MRTKRLYILLVILLMAGGGAFNSCSSIQPTIGTEDSDRIEGVKIDWLNIKCFQTLDNASNYSACLAKDDDWDVYYIVSFTCPGKKKSEIFYDGKSLNGRYVFVGTYTYESKGNGTKTVRAYMPKENFYELYEYNKESLKDCLDVVLSYNAIR